MDYGAFDEVPLPNLTVAETNPAARLDFRRFASDQLVTFNRRQVEIIRAHSPGRFVTYNPTNEPSPGGAEAARVGRELRALPLPPAAAHRRAPVALVFDYEASWITRIQPHGADFGYTELTFRWYEAARRLGLDLDVVAPGTPLSGYDAVLVPTLPHVSDAALAAFRGFHGPLLFGPRTGSKTRTFQIPDALPPGPLQELLPHVRAPRRPGRVGFRAIGRGGSPVSGSGLRARRRGRP